MDELELPSGLFETGCEPTGKKRVNNYFNLRWIEVIKSALEDKVDLISKRFGFRYLCLGSCNPQLQIYCTNYIIASPQPHTSPNRVPVTKKSITGWNDGKKTVTTFCQNHAKRDDGFCNSTSSNHPLPKTSQRRDTQHIHDLAKTQNSEIARSSLVDNSSSHP
ncbi:hypothetical protein YC2023_080000 [Brassica napus]